MAGKISTGGASTSEDETASFARIRELPIYSRQDEILTAVDANQVTIITAETGAGKSTQVPQFLAEHGYRKIIVTQPRILAARNLCYRVRQEYSWHLGRDVTNLVGYRTAPERDDNPENTILYCTDGLQLVRELTGSGTADKQILILDEIHEWNENMEVLIAWAKKRCQEEPRFKVVIMSATIEADKLAAYFSTQAVITVPGRTFPVEKRFGKDLINEITTLLESRTCNMLVFLPGKAEIEAVAEALQRAARGVPIIPLHGQLEPALQQQAFANYPKGKVVLSTNVAQTSITIDDIDVVIDSGLERRAEVRSGVEGLFIAQVSQADCLQRAGRAGRTKEGLYILAQLDQLPCTPIAERSPYGIPEIMRKHIDRLVLRLAAIGIDIVTLDFYHSPSQSAIKLAKHTLINLGALTTSGNVTDIGRKMEQFPVESSYARMLVEAKNCDDTTQSKLATVIAIQEVGGIVKGSTRFSGWRRYTHQTQSDLLASYDIYLAAPAIDPEQYEELGIIAKNVTKAADVIERLHHDLGLMQQSLTPIQDSNELDVLLRCVVAGQLHQLWVIEPDGTASHLGSNQRRELSSGSVVKHAQLVAGTPFDLQIPTPRGLETLHLVNNITAVNPAWLQALAPNTFAVRPAGIYFDEHTGMLAANTKVRYRHKTFDVSGGPVLERSPENQKLFIALYSTWLHRQLEREREQLENSNSRRLPAVNMRQIEDQVRHIAYGAISLAEIDKKRRSELSRLAQLDAYYDERLMASLHNGTEQQGHRHHRDSTHRARGWRPWRRHGKRHG